MASLYITEYENIAYVGDGRGVPVGLEPALATQKVSFTGTPGQSAAFNARTRFVRLHADGIMSIAFGTNPTAAVTDPRVAASTTEFFGVSNAAQGLKVSAITNT